MGLIRKAFFVLYTDLETGEPRSPAQVAAEGMAALLFIAGIPCIVLLCGVSLGAGQ